ncbi:MAG: Gfo/Idh/MocA family oxidoreductase [Thaumarchaeota archaeon]|nr:Gfo/Idh/MocA family oxidoreductase [Nitrososphaerota archaeon]
MRQIRVGVLGCGKNSANHLRVYARTPGVKLVAVCDPVPGRAEQMAREFGAEQTHLTHEAMLKLDLDLVDIVTEAHTHSTLAIQALESGHNVLVEKPMSLSSKDCQEMISASRRSGRLLCVQHNKRFYAGVMEARRLIDQEGLKVSRAHLNDFFIYSDMRPKWTMTDQEGGLLFESMVHHAYLLEHFLGRIERMHAVARRVKNPIFDSYTFLVNTSGPIGVSEFEWDSESPLLAFRIFTEEGVRFDGDLVGDFVLRWPSRRAISIPRTTRKILDDLAVPIQRWRSYIRMNTRMPGYGAVSPYKKTFYVLIRKYLSSIKKQESAPPVPPEEGLRAIEVLEAARKSIESGNTEAVNHADSDPPQ